MKNYWKWPTKQAEECVEINIILDLNQNAGNGGLHKCNIEI